MSAVIFDAMGTLFDLSSLRPRLERVGAPGTALEAWFARLLHSATTLTLVGEFRPFAELAASTLCSVLAQLELDPEDAQEVLGGLSELEPYPDAAEALGQLAAGGVELTVLTNGGRQNTAKLLERAGLDRYITQFATTEDVRAYKPDAAPYRRALEMLGLPADEVTLVAAHAWDTVGARATGMNAIWVKRIERCWPLPLDAVPAAEDLREAAQLVLNAGGGRGTRPATPASEGRTRRA